MKSNKIKIKYLNLDKINFNKKHHRLNLDNDKKSNSNILNYYLESNSIINLILSIAESGYFDTEPLIVIKTKNKQYKVIDGSLRLTALKILQNPSIIRYRKRAINMVLDETTFRPYNIPCIIIKKHNNINKLIGYKHFTGTNRLDIDNKYRYFIELSNDISENNIEIKARKIAKIIGTKAIYVLHYLIVQMIIEVSKKKNKSTLLQINVNNLKIYQLLSIFSFENILIFIGITLNSNPFQNINYLNLQIIIKLLENHISIDELEELNNRLENNSYKEQLSRGELDKIGEKIVTINDINQQITILENGLQILLTKDKKELDILSLTLLHKKLGHFMDDYGND